MWQSLLKTAAATVAFGAVHSALASRPVKRAAEEIFGRRARNGLYRPLYVAGSIVATSALAKSIGRLPDRELYHVRGPLATWMRLGQAAGLAYMAWGASTVGWKRITGLQGLEALKDGEAEVPREPEAQGPAPGPDGRFRPEGPFAQSRHPLNLSPLPVLWLEPRMTANQLAFNLIATAYLVLGSRHEESRLREAYGPAYEAYRRSDVPFYVPSTASTLRSIAGVPAGR
ncbi:MAG: hypothetical protein U0800_19965 [Isosphaeraceae bacterium]